MPRVWRHRQQAGSPRTASVSRHLSAMSGKRTTTRRSMHHVRWNRTDPAGRNDSSQYPAGGRGWKADSSARQRRGGCARRTSRRSLHSAANPAASHIDAIGQRLVYGVAHHGRRGCPGRQYRGAYAGGRRKSKDSSRTQSGQRLRIKGKGVPRTAESRRETYICI